MNNNGLEQFFNAVSTNQDLQEQIQELGGDVDALAAFAKEQGYDVSLEELQAYQDKVQRLLKSRLRMVQQGPASPPSPGVKAFFALTELAETDEAVAKRLEEIGTDAPDDLIAYGKELGFSFTAQDMADVGKEILAPSDELSDEELELAAGGTTLLAAVAFAFVLGGAGLAAGVVVGVAYGGAAAGAAVGVLAVVKALFG